MSNDRFREMGFAIILVLTGYSSDVSAAPKELHKCTTIAESGSYVLSRNLEASGDCLVIAASFVTIDFAGFTISGNGTGACVKDQNIPSVIVVRNGMVTNCQSGIDLHNSTDSLVEHMLVIRNGSGVGIAVNTRSAVVENIVNVNGGDGIGVSNGVARGNVVWSNGGKGIGTGGSSTVIGNTVAENQGDGIAVGGGTIISENVSNNNQGFGILAGWACGQCGGSTVTSNTVVSNFGMAGLSVVCPSNIIGNTAQGNTGPDIVTDSGCNRVNNLPSP